MVEVELLGHIVVVLVGDVNVFALGHLECSSSVHPVDNNEWSTNVESEFLVEELRRKCWCLIDVDDLPSLSDFSVTSLSEVVLIILDIILSKRLDNLA